MTVTTRIATSAGIALVGDVDAVFIIVRRTCRHGARTATSIDAALEALLLTGGAHKAESGRGKRQQEEQAREAVH